MANRIVGARELVAHPRLVELVSSATISAWAARLVVREVEDLTDEQAALVVSHVCDKVLQRRDSGRRSWTSAEVGRAARRARLRMCPDTDQEARQRAFAGRRVQMLPDRHGMATIVADLDATDAHRIHRRLTAIATGLSDPADTRTRDQIRADVLVDILLGASGRCAHSASTGDAAVALSVNAGSSGAAPSGSEVEVAACCFGHPTDGGQCGARSQASARPEISVVMSLADVLGMADDPAHIPGLGPIPARLARTIAADGNWRAWITDASGAVVATGTRSYVPTAALARLVRAREPVCRMPGCRQPASTCDLDHTVPYPVGATTAANLGPLCRRHHVLKTHVGWSLDPVPPSEGVAGGTDQNEPSGDVQGLDPPDPVAWRWGTPAGFTIRDHPDPPHECGS